MQRRDRAAVPTRHILFLNAKPTFALEHYDRGSVLNMSLFTIHRIKHWGIVMNGIVYLVGAVVIVLAILSFLGLR